MALNTVVVGLGAFGLAIGRRLGAFTSTVGVDVDPDRRKVWETLTGKVAYSSFTDIQLNSVQRILIAVRSEDDVEKVIHGISSCLIEPFRGSITVYIVSTISVEFAKRLAQIGELCYLRIVEFPLTGGEVAALTGSLIAMAAGPFGEDEKAFMTSTLTSRIIDFPNYGDPAFAKLLNNVVIAYQVATLNEVIQIAQYNNLDPKSILDVISNGAASSYISKAIMHYNEQLLIKDVQLLKKTVNPLPEIRIDQLENHFITVRKLLS